MDVESFSEVDCFKMANIDCDIDMYDGLDNFIELLDRNNIKSTLFVVSNTLHALRSRLRKYAKNGHEIALHGFNHTPPHKMTDDTFRQTTIWAKQHIEETCGVSISGYRAPYFGLDRSKLDIIRELGFDYDSSQMDFMIAWNNCDMDLSDFRHPRKLIYEKEGFFEYQVGCHKFFGQKYPISGGGYLRMSPWKIMKPALRKHLQENDLYIFYVHPFELSQKKLPRFRKMPFTHEMYLNTGRKNYCNKLDEVIQLLRSEGYQFTTFNELSLILKNENEAAALKICTE